MPVGPRAAILFDALGPYHLARLEAMGRAVPTLALEVASQSAVYGWDPTSGASTFERKMLFPALKARSFRVSDIISRLDQTLGPFKPEVMLVPGWATRPALAMLAWATRHNVPAVVLSESTAHDATRSPWRESVKRSIVSCFAAGLVGGRSHAAYLGQLGMQSDRIFLGYDIVDNAYFAQGAVTARADAAGTRRRLSLTPNPFFLASARFVPIKNLIGLVDAYARYRAGAMSAPWGLVILGDGAMRTEIEVRIAFHRLGDFVIMPGFKQYAELPAYYGLAGAFVHFSEVEPWGLVVNEAMAAGLPVVVSSTCGCTSDLVEERANGFIVDPWDLEALADRLAELAGMAPSARAAMGKRSSEIVTRWSPVRFAEGARSAIEAAMRIGPGPAGPAHRAMLSAYARLF